MRKSSFRKRLAAAAASAVMGVTSVAGAAMNANAADLQLDNYAKLLQYSLYFFDANYCGEGAGAKSHFSWRDDCHTKDVVPYGFHDAGDAIICGLTEGFSASTLGWMYYEYKDEFVKTGTAAHLKDITDEFARFMKASTTLDASGNVTNFVYEIGDDGKDHGKWRAPELMDSRGADETYSTTNGASDVAAQYAAALAQNYINFGNEEDLKYAVALYNFAAKYRTMTYDQMTYSDKSVEDDIAWAAGWLYLATKEQPYLEANSKDTSGTNDWVNDYYYGGVWLGAAIINAEITGNWTAPVNYIKGIVNANSNQFYIMNSWGSARHNTLMQTCALVATKHKDKSGADFSEWCKGQMNMILGDNNANVCLVVGYNDVSATSPHHRAASGLYVDDSWSQWGSWDGNYASVPTSHVLYGALCGGPTSNDFTTFRKYDAKDATSNEVALDYQVGLVGAAAGLFAAYQTGSVVAEIGDEVTVYPEEIAVANGEGPIINEDCTIKVTFIDSDTNQPVSGVEASIKQITEPESTIEEWTSSDEAFDITVPLNSEDKPYVLAIKSLPEGYVCTTSSGGIVFSNGGETVELKVPLNKVATTTATTESTPVTTTVTTTVPVVFASNIPNGTTELAVGDDYLLFISWRGGGQNQVGPEPNKIYGIFSSDNETVATVDEEGIIHAKSAGTANINFSGRTELLEEYQHGKVWTITVIVKDTSGTSTGTYVKMLGDADLSGTISVSDIVTVLQYAANKDKYPLDSRALTNSDVNGDGVVDSKDAFIIQQVDAGVVKQSDLPIL